MLSEHDPELFFFSFFLKHSVFSLYNATHLISSSYILVFTRKGMLSPFCFALFSEISDSVNPERQHFNERYLERIIWCLLSTRSYVLVLWYCFLMFMYKICFPCLRYIHISLNYCAQCCHVCSSLRKRLMLLSLCELFTEFVKQDVWICLTKLSRKGLLLSVECWINSGLCKLRLICSPRPGWDISNFLYLWNM